MTDRTLLYLHGIEADDTDGSWLEGLEASLRRAGSEPLAERGFKVLAPSYLALLDGEPPTEDVEPRYTYCRRAGWVETAAQGMYLLRQSELQRILADVPQPAPGPVASAPEWLADVLTPWLFDQAHRYRSHPARRHAIIRHIVDQLPPEGELVIVAHSLGSVVAADLIYHLPPELSVRLLVTIGSPLGWESMRRHLTRLNDTFPFTKVDSWMNVIGHHDPVAGSRGLAASLPEALDVFVDNGIGEDVHNAVRYLDQDVIARAFDWVTHTPGAGVVLPGATPTETLVAVVAGAQFALRLEQQPGGGPRRARFGKAREKVTLETAKRLRESGETHPVLNRLLRDNSDFLRGKLQPTETIAVLLTAAVGNPVQPYEIKIDDKDRQHALRLLALDLGVPNKWADTVLDVLGSATKAHKGFDWWKATLVVTGLAAVIAAPLLVLAAAPAGLAGGAAVVAGLAAFGPGGMVGGLTLLGLVAGVGGSVATSALTAGSSEEVQQNVIFIQALALAKARLQLPNPGHSEWFKLGDMEMLLAPEVDEQKELSDGGAPSVKETQRKLESVKNAQKWMRRHDLDAPEIESTPSETTDRR